LICDTLHINGNVLNMTTKSPVASAFAVDGDVQGALLQAAGSSIYGAGP